MTSAIGSGAHSGLTIAKVAQVVDMALVSVREAHTAFARFSTDAVVITPKKLGRSQAAVSVVVLREVAESSRAAYEAAVQANDLVQASIERLVIPKSVHESIQSAGNYVSHDLKLLNGQVKRIEDARSLVDGIPEIHNFRGTAEELKDIVQSAGRKSTARDAGLIFHVGEAGGKHKPFLLGHAASEYSLESLKNALISADSVTNIRAGTADRIKQQLATIDAELVATYEGILDRPVAAEASAPALVAEIFANTVEAHPPATAIVDATAAPGDLAAKIDEAIQTAPAYVETTEPDVSWMDNIVMPTPRVRPSAAVDDAILDRATAVMNRA